MAEQQPLAVSPDNDANPAQGRLFEYKLVSDGVTDPELQTFRAEITAGPFMGEKPESLNSGTDDRVETTTSYDLLPNLQRLVRNLSDANMRRGFVRAPEVAVHASASSRGLSDNEALDQAGTNSGDFLSNAELEYNTIKKIIAAGMGLLALLGADTGEVRKKTLAEIRASVSGAENRGLRQKIYSSDQLSSEQSMLLVESEKVVREVDPKLKQYLPLKAAFKIDKNSAPIDQSLPTIFDGSLLRLPNTPNGVLLDTDTKRAYVTNVNGYRRSLRTEPGGNVPDERYKSALASKGAWLQIVAGEFEGEVIVLEDAKTAILNTNLTPGKMAEALEPAMQVLLKKVDLIANKKDMTAEAAELEKTKLKFHLLKGKVGKASNVSRKAAWLSSIEVAIEHSVRSRDLFRQNSLALMD